MKRPRTPLEETYSTSFMAEYFHTWVDLPQKLKGARIVDVGAGGSNLSQYLRERGADAYAVDPRYADGMQPLFDSLKKTNGLDAIPLEVRNFREKIEAWFMRNGSTWHKNQYAFGRMLADAQKHPEKYLVGWADQLPFENESVDFVHSLEAVSAFLMGDVDELRNSIREMIRVLKPGGQLQINPWPDPTLPWEMWRPEQISNAATVQRDLESSVYEWRISPSLYAEADLVITK